MTSTSDSLDELDAGAPAGLDARVTTAAVEVQQQERASGEALTSGLDLASVQELAPRGLLAGPTNRDPHPVARPSPLTCGGVV